MSRAAVTPSPIRPSAAPGALPVPCPQTPSVGTPRPMALPEDFSLSLVVLFYNEVGAVAGVIDEAQAAASTLGVPTEIIAVDDGSTDGTEAILDRLASEVPNLRIVRHRTNRGYGTALRSGLNAAEHNWVFYTDGDAQFRLSELPGFLDGLRVAPIVLGFRQTRHDTFQRRLLGRGWTFVANTLLHLGVRDVNCAYKLFPRSAIQALPLRSQGASIDAELLAGLKGNGHRWTERPVDHLERRSGEATGANPRVIAKALREMFAVTFRSRLGV